MLRHGGVSACMGAADPLLQAAAVMCRPQLNAGSGVSRSHATAATMPLG